MLQQLFKQWWIHLVQGLLLIILSFFIFDNPEAVLAGISMWFGIIVLLAGVVGIIAWMVTDKNERGNTSLFWSILTAIFGLVMLANILATMKTLTLIFGVWVLVTSIHLIQAGWPYRKEGSTGWVLVIAGILSAIAAILMIFNIRTGAVAISTLLGLQVLLTGFALVLLSFAKKALVGRIKEKLAS